MGVDLTGIGTAASAVKDIIGMFFPDKTEEEKAKLAATLELMRGQLDVNKQEAASSSLFVAGWRPSVGWVCSASLAMLYIPKAVVMTIIWTKAAWAASLIPGATIPAFPDLGVGDLIGLLMALLGMAGLRSFDKLKGSS